MDAGGGDTDGVGGVGVPGDGATVVGEGEGEGEDEDEDEGVGDGDGVGDPGDGLACVEPGGVAGEGDDTASGSGAHPAMASSIRPTATACVPRRWTYPHWPDDRRISTASSLISTLRLDARAVPDGRSWVSADAGRVEG